MEDFRMKYRKSGGISGSTRPIPQSQTLDQRGVSPFARACQNKEKKPKKQER